MALVPLMLVTSVSTQCDNLYPDDIPTGLGGETAPAQARVKGRLQALHVLPLHDQRFSNARRTQVWIWLQVTGDLDSPPRSVVVYITDTTPPPLSGFSASSGAPPTATAMPHVRDAAYLSIMRRRAHDLIEFGGAIVHA